MAVEAAVWRRRVRVASGVGAIPVANLALGQAHSVEVLRDLAPEGVGAEGVAVEARGAEQVLRPARVCELGHSGLDRLLEASRVAEIAWGKRMLRAQLTSARKPPAPIAKA